MGFNSVELTSDNNLPKLTFDGNGSDGVLIRSGKAPLLEIVAGDGKWVLKMYGKADPKLGFEVGDDGYIVVERADRRLPA